MGESWPRSRFSLIIWLAPASSVSGQDEPNRALWLATRAGKMEPSCPLGTTRSIPQAKFHQKPYKKSFIDQVCSVKMAEYWPRSFFASLLTSTSSRSINTQKKNLANIQPSWPHTWSITRIHTGTPARLQVAWLPMPIMREPGHDFDNNKKMAESFTEYNLQDIYWTNSWLQHAENTLLTAQCLVAK